MSVTATRCKALFIYCKHGHIQAALSSENLVLHNKDTNRCILGVLSTVRCWPGPRMPDVNILNKAVRIMQMCARLEQRVAAHKASYRADCIV